MLTRYIELIRCRVVFNIKLQLLPDLFYFGQINEYGVSFKQLEMLLEDGNQLPSFGRLLEWLLFHLI